MRNIIKKIKVEEVEVLVYNTKKKEEETLTIQCTEIDKEIHIPKNCVELKRKILKSEVKTFRMTPQEFVKHAEVVEETKAD